MVATNSSYAQLTPIPQLVLDMLRRISAVRIMRHGSPEPIADTELLVDAAEIVLASRLAGSIGPHFTSLKNLASSGTFITLTVKDNDEAIEIYGFLNSCLATYSKLPEVESDDDILLLRSLAHNEEDITNASLYGKTVIFVQAADKDPPVSRQLGSDLILDCAPPTTSDLELAIRLVTGDGPPEILKTLTAPDRLSSLHISSCIRGGRSGAKCVEMLLGLLPDSRPLAPISVQITKLDSAVGYGAAKDWAQNLARDFALWTRGELDWLDVPNTSVLLSGPPGTGKSTFPPLVAAALGVQLIATSVAEWNASEHLGKALSSMSESFARHEGQPAVLFIDEIDGVGRRSSGQSGYSRNITNHLLVQLDAARATPGLIVMGATNLPELVDPALLRSGRMAIHFALSLPGLEDRAVILKNYIGEAASTSECKTLASRLEGASGADIEDLVRHCRGRARAKAEPFRIDHIHAALQEKLATLSPSDKRRVATYLAGTQLVAEALQCSLLTARIPLTKSKLLDQLTVLMGGRAAEELVFGEPSDFGAKDLRAATSLAWTIEGALGMGEVGTISLGAPVAEIPAHLIGAVRRHIERANDRALQILLDNVSCWTARIGPVPQAPHSTGQRLPDTNKQSYGKLVTGVCW